MKPLLVILASVSILTGSGAQTGIWTNLQPPVAPPWRATEGFANEPVSGAFLAYGGASASAIYSDTWAFDGCTWIPLSPATNPGPRTNVTMAASPTYASVVLFGGNSGTGQLLGATWEFSLQTLAWTNVTPAGPSPAARELAGLAYDSARGRTVLFGGGNAANGTFYSDTWEWDGTNWLNVTPLGQSPLARAWHSMTYDSLRARTVIYGGYNGSQLGDTWEWDGIQWTHVVTPSSPGARSSGAMAYDPWSQRTVLFAGSLGWPNGLNDVWEYDGANWVQATIFGSSPPNQYLHRMAGDPVRGGILVYGSYGDNWVPLNDTWRYQRASLTTNTLYPPVGTFLGYTISLPGDGNLPYLMAISGSGICPGVALPDGRVVSLSVDAYTNVCLSGQFPNVFQGFSGVLSPVGSANPVLGIPGIPSLIGLPISTVAVSAAGPNIASITNPVTVVLQ